MAGLLAFSISTPSHPLHLPVPGQWQKMLKNLNEITASGNAPDFHRIPYYFEPNKTRPKNHGGKSNSPKCIFQDKNYYYHRAFFLPDIDMKIVLNLTPGYHFP